MKIIPQLFAVSLLSIGSLLVTGCTAAEKVPDPNEHVQHHPAGTADAIAAPASASVLPTAADKPMQCKAGKMSHMDDHMKIMQEVREKMAAAKTPEERKALMAEGKKRMHEGMAMMKKMNEGAKHEGMKQEGKMSGMMGEGGMSMKGEKDGMQCKMHERHQMMEKRMEMMQSMMEMMMENMSSDADK